MSHSRGQLVAIALPLLHMPRLISCDSVAVLACDNSMAAWLSPSNIWSVQDGAINIISAAGDEAARSVSIYMRELRQREIDIAVVRNRSAEEVSMISSVLYARMPRHALII